MKESIYAKPVIDEQKSDFSEEKDDRTEKITLRFTSKERSLLVRNANEKGLTLSEFLRGIIFPKRQKNIPTNDSELMHNIQVSVKGLRTEFKRIADDFNLVTSAYVKNPSGDNNTRQIQELIEVVLELQRGLNLVLGFVNEAQTFKAVPVNLPGVQEDAALEEQTEQPKQQSTLTLKYYYMQKVSIIGFLIEDAKEFEKDGDKRMRLLVCVESNIGETKKRTIYTVFGRKSGIFDYLKKGKQVYVSGDIRFTFERDKEKKIVTVDGEPVLNPVISSDTITLCSSNTSAE